MLRLVKKVRAEREEARTKKIEEETKRLQLQVDKFKSVLRPTKKNVKARKSQCSAGDDHKKSDEEEDTTSDDSDDHTGDEAQQHQEDGTSPSESDQDSSSDEEQQQHQQEETSSSESDRDNGKVNRRKRKKIKRSGDNNYGGDDSNSCSEEEGNYEENYEEEEEKVEEKGELKDDYLPTHVCHMVGPTGVDEDELSHNDIKKLHCQVIALNVLYSLQLDGVDKNKAAETAGLAVHYSASTIKKWDRVYSENELFTLPRQGQASRHFLDTVITPDDFKKKMASCYIDLEATLCC